MPASANHSVTLALSPSEAWDRLSDLTLAPHYVPGLTGCQLHAGPRLGLGASRRVFRKYGQWLDESVIDWQDGAGFVLRLHRGEAGAPFPFRTATFRYALLADRNGTRLSTRMDYQLRGGPLVERLLAKAFAKVVRQVTENLKAYYETGMTQNRDFAQ